MRLGNIRRTRRKRLRIRRLGVRIPPSAPLELAGSRLAVAVTCGRRAGAIPTGIPIAVGMATSYRDAAVGKSRAKRAAVSVRQRSPGVWEIRVVVGFDAVRGRSVQRSFTVQGDEDFVERRRRDLVDDYGVTRVEFTTAGAGLTVGELMERFFEAPHLWKPATVISHRPLFEPSSRPARPPPAGRAHRR